MDDDGVILTFAGIMIVLLLFGITQSQFVSNITKTQMDATGTLFCESYNLSYKTYKISDDKKSFVFVCQDQPTKVDGIGVLGPIGQK